MRRAALVFVLAVLCCKPALAIKSLEAETLFSGAVQAYKEGRFDEAVRINEEILAGGMESAAVYYNLGNAYLKKRILGKAILNYLRSEKLAPRDADVRANLAFSRSNVENYLSFFPDTVWARAVSLRRVSDDELKWAILFVFMFAAGYFLVGIYRKTRGARILGGVLLMGAVLIYGLGVGMMRTASGLGHAVILRSEEARYEPSQDATTFFKISEGAEVRVLREEDDWVKIERPDGKAAWVSREAVEKVDL